MGTTEEREWVAVANDLLTKCNIELHVNNLSDCGATVFIRLYESILGEKVPDLIAMPTCQEDDAHNVQAIIDSLALDYLQVSLSHITGENIVKGNKEPIRNLLEVMDGLLEYLTEEINSTASHDCDALNQMTKNEIQSACLEAQEDDCDVPVPSLKLPSAEGESRSYQSSELFVPSWEVDGSESTSELIKLGDTAYLFSLRNEELMASREISKTTIEPKGLATIREPSSDRRALATETQGTEKAEELPRVHMASHAKKLGDPIRPAIPLQPPYQPLAPQLPCLAGKGSGSSGRHSPSPVLPPERPPGPASSDLTESPGQESAPPSDGILSLSRTTSHLPSGEGEPASVAGIFDAPVPERRTDDEAGKETDENVHYTPTPCFEDSLPRFASTQSTRPKQRILLTEESQNESSPLTSSLSEEAFPLARAKERLSRQELSEMSEKLSRRLNELDAMLKYALGERNKEESLADDDQLSQHSDSIMDYRRRKPEPATLHHRRKPGRQRSLSTSPPPASYQQSSELGNGLQKDARGPARKMRERLQKEQEERNLRAKLLMKAYEDELRAYETSEQLELAKLKAKAKEMEQKHKHLFKEPPRTSQVAHIYSRKNVPRNSKLSQWISRGGFAKPKKAPPLKVMENDLLPLLLEEFPHLHVSRPAMNKMWRQQLAQIEHLKSPSDRARMKLQSEVLETVKKHDLLVDLIKKDQAQNRRLQEFKQRIHRQRCTQNKIRERRQQIARAKKYYQDYRVQLRAKMMRARTREERFVLTLICIVHFVKSHNKVFN
ncbi:centrosomal protein of 95 kDa isoform X2 [Varanus komodoensis]|uniref:centrosomal protein of 95 kDa isoform X2 n=1 Tax=Varanus komodoensis TaxID=61221 RepID=UPI001CF7E058|nr:centrosomal protein of 95 kDa isoform X2 [Varanus komodoensis]